MTATVESWLAVPDATVHAVFEQRANGYGERMSGAIFAMPSFLSGAARTLDMFGTFDSYVECKDGVTADRRALFSDVVAVGEDWKRALTEWAAVNVPDRERQEQISR